jgi:hypothetical protein
MYVGASISCAAARHCFCLKQRPAFWFSVTSASRVPLLKHPHSASPTSQTLSSACVTQQSYQLQCPPRVFITNDAIPFVTSLHLFRASVCGSLSANVCNHSLILEPLSMKDSLRVYWKLYSYLVNSRNSIGACCSTLSQ